MTDNEQTQSLENSKKLDGLATGIAHLTQLIEGQHDAPGILGRLALHEEMLFGRKGGRGLVSKVDIMWRLHVWLLCGLSAIAGWLLRELATKIHL